MAIFSGQTENEAIEKGLKELGLDKKHTKIKVLQEPRKGVLGAFAKEAQVEIIEITEEEIERNKKLLKYLLYGGGVFVVIFFILPQIFLLFLGLFTHKINPPINSSEVNKYSYKTINDKFKQSGFKEIQIEPVNSAKKNKIVDSVTIDDNKDFTTKSKFKEDVPVIIKYNKVKKSTKLVLKINDDFTADEKGNVIITGVTNPKSEVKIGFGIIGDTDTADKKGKFTLKDSIDDTDKYDKTITINVINGNKDLSKDVIIHQNPNLIKQIAETEAKEKAEQKKQEEEEKAAAEKLAEQDKIKEEYNKTHEAYKQRASDYSLIYLIDKNNKTIKKVNTSENYVDSATYTGDMDTRIDFTFNFSDGGSYPMSAHHKYSGMDQFAIFIGENDGIKNQLEKIDAYEVKYYFE